MRVVLTLHILSRYNTSVSANIPISEIRQNIYIFSGFRRENGPISVFHHFGNPLIITYKNIIIINGNLSISVLMKQWHFLLGSLHVVFGDSLPHFNLHQTLQLLPQGIGICWLVALTTGDIQQDGGDNSKLMTRKSFEEGIFKLRKLIRVQ